MEAYSKVNHGPPPPARGRRPADRALRAAPGTTPASAGTTVRSRPGRPRGRDHPRQRGDDVNADSRTARAAGPPPPARGRRSAAAACWFAETDHPRQRGDDPPDPPLVAGVAGPPPPARGRPREARRVRLAGGTTPASAGTTEPPLLSCSPTGDHPRQRGDDHQRLTGRGSGLGPPPPARGRPVPGWVVGAGGGTTPASAGTTHPTRQVGGLLRDHPRQRGDDAELIDTSNGPPGPPPPARGRQQPATRTILARGTTPASAGTTDRRAHR